MNTPAEPPRIAITGATGNVGRVLVDRLPEHGFAVIPLSRSKHGTDFSNPPQLQNTFRDCAAVVHLAWQYATDANTSGGTYLDNLMMNRLVLQASLDAGVPRVIMASSVHADFFFDHTGLEHISPNRPPRGNGPYGCAKIIAEQDALGFANRGLDVIALRLGAVTSDNQPHPTDPWEQRVFLHHDDLLDLIDLLVRAPHTSPRCTMMFAVSDNPGRAHDTTNPFGWRPRRRSSETPER
ncbi:MAG: NAD(P)-dependent oxidoreductase [Planctomycetota bacterium]